MTDQVQSQIIDPQKVLDLQKEIEELKLSMPQRETQNRQEQHVDTERRVTNPHSSNSNNSSN